MGYERYPRNTNPQGDYYGRQDPQDYGRDYGSGRDYSASSARDYQAAGAFDDDRRGYGARDYGNQRYGQRDRFDQGHNDRGGNPYGNRAPSQDRYGDDGGYRGSYAHDGRRFEDVGRYRHADDDNYRRDGRGQGTGYGRQPQGYEYEDRGFFARAGDEVRSWFGDEDAERRREYDARNDERYYGGRDDSDRDGDYHSWRRGQIDALDRDYHEYRQENRTKFHNEFATWRTSRQTQRDALAKVTEHMDVVGSDGAHVGTVDKVRGDRILLSKNDSDAGGRHHSIPSRWIETVDTKVTLSKSSADAKQAWRDEENNQAMFGDTASRGTQVQGDGNQTRDAQGRVLNKSFSGTY